jgi:hypothetical protein
VHVEALHLLEGDVDGEGACDGLEEVVDTVNSLPQVRFDDLKAQLAGIELGRSVRNREVGKGRGDGTSGEYAGRNRAVT